MLRRPPLRALTAAAGGAFLAFGLYHVHSFAQITEGGVLGLTLLLEHWFGISPAWSGLVLNLACYLLGWRTLGHMFLVYSAAATAGFSLCYGLCEQFPPLWPQLAAHPLAAALLGAVFVGLGAGVGVRAGGASGGDDALSMALSKRTGRPIEQIYLFSDLLVLGLSASYLPLRRLGYSVVTVLLSGRIIGLVERAGRGRGTEKEKKRPEEKGQGGAAF